MKLLLLIAHCIAASYYTTIKDKVKNLHDLTGLSTYYEFCGLSENATRDQIKRAFRKLKKAPHPPSLTSEQYKKLVDDGYSLIFGIRNAYDEFLSNSKYIYLDEASNYRNHFYLMLLVGIFAMIFLDLFVYGIRYVWYYDRLERQRIAKKEKKRARSKGSQTDGDVVENDRRDSKKQPNPPTSVMQYLFRRARRRLGK